MEEEKFSPHESIKVIEEMIGKVKTSYHETGIGPILWGVVIAICSIVSYFAFTQNHPKWFYIWNLTIVAVIPTVYIGIKEKRIKQFTSLTDEVDTAIWTVFGLSMFMMAVISSKDNNVSAAIYMLIYGIPTIISGWINKFKVMILGGILCWIFAITSLYLKTELSFLLMAASAIVAWLIPGMIMNARFRKQKLNQS